ncbi:MAG: nitroreductase family protein [Dehalococcoidales bacterium]|nr:nitroreductase family protein [Dehalococcoidales bacterium]
MDTLEVIGKRASLKMHLSPREIEREKIIKVLEAARMAPSARNMQPWRFIVVQDRKVVKTLMEKAFPEGNQVVGNAPVIIVACANPGDDVMTNGREYYLFDVGLAVENMLLAATALGLVTHPMAGINEEELKKVLNFPPQVRLVAVTPLAYPAEGSYEEASKARRSERTRKEVKEFTYGNTWGNQF